MSPPPALLLAVAAAVLALAAGCGPKPQAPAGAAPSTEGGLHLGTGAAAPSTPPTAPAPTPPAVPGPPTAAVAPAPPTSTPTARRPHYFKRVVALCVGIDRYQSDGIGGTEACEADARAVGKHLREQFAYEVVELIRGQATRAAILGEVERLTKELGEQDALVVFFAGHGQVVEQSDFRRSGYLVPYDADLDLQDTQNPDEWAARAIDMRALARGVEGSKVQHVLFLVDACFSGFMTRRGGFTSAHSELLARRSRTVLAATTDNQTATPDPASGLGRFTTALLAQLRGGDPVAVSDVFQKAQDAVVKGTRGMTPQRGDFGEEAGEFVFIPADYPASKLASAFQYLSDRARQRADRRTTPDQFHLVIDAADYRNGTKAVELAGVWEARFRRFQENAAFGDPVAAAAAALCLAKGLGADADPRAAYRAARTAFDTARPEGRYVLGHCLMHGVGTARNEQAAIKVWLDLHNDGSPLGMLGMGDYMLTQRLPAHVLATMRGDYEKSVAGGLAIAELRRVDAWLRTGDAPQAELTRLLPIVRELARAGNPVAMFRMYGLLTWGDKHLEDKVANEAGSWLLKAAEAGLAPAQATLACEYYRKAPLPSRLELETDKVKQIFLVGKWANFAIRQKHPVGNKVYAMLNLYGDWASGRNLGQAAAFDREVRRLDPNDVEWAKWFAAEYRRVSRDDD